MGKLGPMLAKKIGPDQNLVQKWPKNAPKVAKIGLILS